MYNLFASNGISFRLPMELSELVDHSCRLENAGYRTHHTGDNFEGISGMQELMEEDFVYFNEDTRTYHSTDEGDCG